MSKAEKSLWEAFAGESQANRKYLAYAEKADAEGFPQVGRMFRAAAEAETVHAHNHLRALGAVGTTEANLKEYATVICRLCQEEDLRHLHETFLYPTVRIFSAKAAGSGTLLYSEKDSKEPDDYLTFVLTNHHVVEDLISYKKQWDSLLKREVEKEVL